MQNGVTSTEMGAIMAHLAVYTGWPRVFSAMPVFRNVFENPTAK